MSTSSEWGVVAGVAVLMVAAGFVYLADTERLERHRPGAELWVADLGDYSDREDALDALALQYLADFTDDRARIRDIASMFWCLTPVLRGLASVTPDERSRVALRGRARAMVIRSGGVPKDVPLDGGAEPKDTVFLELPEQRVTARR